MNKKDREELKKSFKRADEIYDSLKESICTAIFYKVIFKALKQYGWSISWGMGSAEIYDKKGYQFGIDGKIKRTIAYNKLEKEVTDLYSKTPFWKIGEAVCPLWEVMSTAKFKPSNGISAFFSVETGKVCTPKAYRSSHLLY